VRVHPAVSWVWLNDTEPSSPIGWVGCRTGAGNGATVPAETYPPPRVARPHDEEGSATFLEGDIIFDEDDTAVDERAEARRTSSAAGASLPLIATTPFDRGGGERGPVRRPTHAHAQPRLSRRERRAARKDRLRRRPTWPGRHPKSMIVLVVLVLLTPVWISAGSAAVNPANGNTVGVRLTEWLRGHGGGGVVTWAENTWYSMHAPPKGGKPAQGAIPAPTRTTTTTAPAGPAHLAAPAALVPFVASPTPGEGQWHPIGRTVDGVPAMYAAYLRPNAVNTSLVTGVAWMDTKLLGAGLYAGTTIPGTGQTFANAAPITGAALGTLDAAFNSGFRMQDSQGGFYLNGVTSAGYPLQPGRASLVIDSNGTPSIGSWGTDVSMTPSVVAVRQNLDLIVDHGAPVPGLDANDNHRWGLTLGGRIQVWRSGLGITATGALVYVGGSGLSIVDLANVLARAGAVRAMEMDINTSWINFTSFAPPAGAPASAATGTDLTSDEATSPTRYFQSLSRDFITMSVRPTAATGTVAGTATSTTRAARSASP
jgi:hypothetical protein